MARLGLELLGSLIRREAVKEQCSEAWKTSLARAAKADCMQGKDLCVISW